MTPQFRVSSTLCLLLRLLPRGVPGRAARRGLGHHALAQQHRRQRSDGQSGPVALSLPRLQVRRLHPGHTEPAAPAAGAQLHLHVPQHRAGGGAGEGEEAQGAFALQIAGFILKMKTFFFFFLDP